MTPEQKSAIKFALLAINRVIRVEHPATVEIVDLHIAAGKLSDVLEADGTFIDEGTKAQQVAVPTGYALVPAEPTPTMILAGRFTPCSPGEENEDIDEDYRKVYRSMLKAAPQPPQGDTL